MRLSPYQWKALNDELPNTEPSHAIENFRIAAGELLFLTMLGATAKQGKCVFGSMNLKS